MKYFSILNKLKKIITLSLFAIIFLCSLFSFFSCSDFLYTNKTDTIKIYLPTVEKNEFDLITQWKVNYINKFSSKTIYFDKTVNSFCLKIEKDILTSILIYPVVEEKSTSTAGNLHTENSKSLDAEFVVEKSKSLDGDFHIENSTSANSDLAPHTNEQYFCPLGVVYPFDFINSSSVNAEFTTGAYSQIVSNCIKKTYYNSNKNKNFEKQINYFNWNKLKNAITKKENIFFDNENFNYLSFLIDIEKTSNNILNPKEKVNIYYSDYFLIEDLQNYKNSYLQNYLINKNLTISYIPLIEHSKKNNYIIIKDDPLNNYVALMCDNKIIYIEKSKLNINHNSTYFAIF